ncbi:MAG: DUF3119 family protein [Leptolyngbya sp. SIO1D8]|nr:DUF3119 family protein [Leptolyngbya sp. SIO1D8]
MNQPFKKPVTALSIAETTTLKPSYRIPISLVILAIPLAFLQIWVAGGLSLFGLFLLYQTATLRLVFTATDLDIYRGETRIRRFPYKAWQLWEIFWSPVPILFYFREVNSIHFLPILFSPSELRSQLEQRVPLQVD